MHTHKCTHARTHTKACTNTHNWEYLSIHTEAHIHTFTHIVSGERTTDVTLAGNKEVTSWKLVLQLVDRVHLN